MKLTKMLVSLAMVAMLACTACVGFASEAIQIGFIGPLTGGAAVIWRVLQAGLRDRR